MKRKCVLYLGNGFDVACGLKTKYSQFIESNIFEQLVKECNLASWIKDKYTKDKDKWSDLEELLFCYSLYLQDSNNDSVHFEKITADFRDGHRRLTLALQEYIINQYSGILPTNIHKLVDSWNMSLTIDGVCCFNYTPNAVLVNVLPNYDKLFRIHGSLCPQQKEAEIKVKLGIDRCMKVCPEHSFLYKDNMPNYAYGVWTEPDSRLIAASQITHESIHPAFFNADVIIIYGCSLGRSDTAYYKYLFANANTQKIFIYHFGNKEEIYFRERILELTDDKNIFKRVYFIDNSIDNGYRDDFGKCTIF
jgi:hypothetical protein